MKKIVFFAFFLLLVSCNFRNVGNFFNQIKADNNIESIELPSFYYLTNSVDSSSIPEVVDDSLVKDYINNYENKKYPYTKIPHLDSALFYANINLREIGNNYGFTNKHFEAKIREQGWRRPQPYCAFSVKTFMKMGNATRPKNVTGLAKSFIKKESISAKSVMIGKHNIEPGYAAIWQKGDTYKGHIGVVYFWNKVSGIVVEGNTSSGEKGSQSEGNGVFIRSRKIEPRNYFRITKFTKISYD